MSALFFVIPMISALPGMAIVVLAIIGARRRKRRLISLHSEFEPTASDATLLDVRYASHRRFRSYLKLFPWEMVGVLIVRARGIDAQLLSTDGRKRIALSFRSGSHTIEWKKAEFLRNGIIPWLIISGAGDEKHYFTSETGATIFGSKRRNDMLIESIQKTLHLAKCRRCEYLLWGNTTGVCPECGTAFARPFADGDT